MTRPHVCPRIHVHVNIFTSINLDLYLSYLYTPWFTSVITVFCGVLLLLAIASSGHDFPATRHAWVCLHAVLCFSLTHCHTQWRPPRDGVSRLTLCNFSEVYMFVALFELLHVCKGCRSRPSRDQHCRSRPSRDQYFTTASCTFSNVGGVLRGVPVAAAIIALMLASAALRDLPNCVHFVAFAVLQELAFRYLLHDILGPYSMPTMLASVFCAPSSSCLSFQSSFLFILWWSSCMLNRCFRRYSQVF